MHCEGLINGFIFIALQLYFVCFRYTLLHRIGYWHWLILPILPTMVALPTAPPTPSHLHLLWKTNLSRKNHVKHPIICGAVWRRKKGDKVQCRLPYETIRNHEGRLEMENWEVGAIERTPYHYYAPIG